MENSFTCGCGCWGFLIGFAVFCIALLLGAVFTKAFAVGGLVVVLCFLIGVAFDIVSTL